MRRFVPGLVAAGLLALPLGLRGTAQAPPTAAPRPQASAGTSALFGRVIEAGSTAPVPDAVITISGAGLAIEPSPAGMTPVGSRRVAADGGGWFLFRGLPAGSYRLSAAAPGFVDGHYGRGQPLQVPRSLDLVRTIDVANGELRGDIVLSLWRHGVITGIVRDDAGEPMVGIPVHVITRVTIGGGPVMQIAERFTTDDRGMYVAEVIPGEYLVAMLASAAVVPTGGLDEYLQAVARDDDQARELLREFAGAGASMSREPTARVGALAIAQPGAGRNLPPPRADAGGQLVLYPTTYHPASSTPATAAIVKVGSGEEKAGIDLLLSPRRAQRVSGRALGPEGPVPNLGLRMAPTDPSMARTSPAVVIDEMVAVTDATGAFTFLGVVPGEYTLRGWRNGRSDASGSVTTTMLWTVQTVSVGDSDVTDLTVTLRPGATFRGHVVFAGDRPPPAQPFRNLGVMPRAVPGSVAAIVSAGLGRNVDEQGHFTTPPGAPGPYVLSVTGAPAGWTVRSAMVGGVDALDVPVELGETGVEQVIVTLSDRTSSIAGIARGASGRPADMATVGVFPVDKSLWRRVGMGSRRTAIALPDRQGRYRLGGLPSGEYFVVAIEGAAFDLSDHATLTRLVPLAARLSLADGESRTQDLRTVAMK